MFEKLQVNGYDKENDVVVQVTTSNLTIALTQYNTVKESCDNGNIVNAETGELYAHFSFDTECGGIRKTEWVNDNLLEAIEELTEYGCP